jgi:hypothetical protein
MLTELTERTPTDRTERADRGQVLFSLLLRPFAANVLAGSKHAAVCWVTIKPKPKGSLLWLL